MTSSAGMQRASATHPYSVDDVAELPGTLQPVATAALPSDARVGFIFVVPPGAYGKGLFGLRRVPEQALLFTYDGVLHVQAADAKGGTPTATYFAVDRLLYLRSDLLLLYGRLELAGLVEGAPARAVVEYNTVAWERLQPSLQRLVRLATGQTLSANDRRAVYWESQLDRLSFKFANGVRYYAVLPGDTLQGIAYQLPMWAPHLYFLRREITPQTALVLTERCVVIMEEDPAITRRNAKYGWMFTYIPRRAVSQMHMAPLLPGQELTIGMACGAATAERKLVLTDETAGAWTRLWAAHAEPQTRQPQPMGV
jgi:hypothetical protein